MSAILHRDYKLDIRRIRLFEFEDRLELSSPGTLANSLEIESMHRQQATQNETVASLLRSLRVEGIFGSGDRQRFLEDRGEGVPTIRERTRQLAGRDPESDVIGGNELLLRIPASPVPSGESTGQVSATASGAPLVSAQILVQHPDGTWHIERTDSFARAAFSLHSDIPMTVLCAAPGHRARAVRDWRSSREISIDLDPFPDGGSVVLMDGAGQVPNLRSRLTQNWSASQFVDSLVARLNGEGVVQGRSRIEGGLAGVREGGGARGRGSVNGLRAGVESCSVMEDHSQLEVRRAMVVPGVGGAEGENPGSEAVAAEFGHQLKSARTG